MRKTIILCMIVASISVLSYYGLSLENNLSVQNSNNIINAPQMAFATSPVSPLANLQAVPSDNLIGASSYYYISFTPPLITPIRTIEITFPSGFVLTNATVLQEQFPTSVISFQISGQKMTFVFVNDAVSANYPYFIFLGGIGNANSLKNQISVTARDSANNITFGPTLSSVFTLSGIKTVMINNAAVGPTKIGNGAITNPKILNNSINSTQIIDGSITSAKISPNFIKLAHLEPGVCGLPTDVNGLSVNVGWCPTGSPQSNPTFFINDTSVNANSVISVNVNIAPYTNGPSCGVIQLSPNQGFTIRCSESQNGNPNLVPPVGAKLNYAIFSPSPTSQPSVTSIVNTSYKIGPGTYTPVPFSLSCPASLTGTFSAYAGLGNNVDLFVFDQNNFQKYQSNNAYTPLYYNQRTGSGTFILNMNSGNYYIVLSNTYSIISEKNVDLQASYTCN